MAVSRPLVTLRRQRGLAMRLDDVRTAEFCELRLAEQFLHGCQSEGLTLIEQCLIDARSLQIRKGLIHIVELANASGALEQPELAHERWHSMLQINGLLIGGGS